jgi:hypothetical protein
MLFLHVLRRQEVVMHVDPFPGRWFGLDACASARLACTVAAAARPARKRRRGMQQSHDEARSSATKTPRALSAKEIIALSSHKVQIFYSSLCLPDREDNEQTFAVRAHDPLRSCRRTRGMQRWNARLNAMT